MTSSKCIGDFRSRDVIKSFAEDKRIEDFRFREEFDRKAAYVNNEAVESCSLDRFGESSTGLMQQYASWFKCEEKIDSDVGQMIDSAVASDVEDKSS
ncbi:hypothetical protein F511_38042 [Dorcoceras hygrometricum]|uniref:Uncharacterized protein n=1 Tax=Dorcoceras hygrometricum TaxID=472368 RepID=A0A2Z7BHN8_9LAMI|nr:hypothetical protein F511_38042 [Dorcoceras hygrometricum]